MNKIVFLDTETWWLDEDTNALLTIGYTITNGIYNIIESREYKVPINGTIEDSALAINGLDVTDWRYEKTVAEVVQDIIDAVGDVEEAAIYWHNIQFDLNFIKAQDKEAYLKLKNFFKRNVVDTKSLLIHAMTECKYDGSVSMHKFMWLQPKKHSAIDDTKINVELVKKFNLINNN